MEWKGSGVGAVHLKFFAGDVLVSSQNTFVLISDFLFFDTFFQTWPVNLLLYNNLF